MTKDQMVRRIAKKLGLPQIDVSGVIDELGSMAAAALVSGEDVPVFGVGRIKPVTRAARLARNPRTGQEVPIPARRSVAFKASSSLKAALAGPP
jgi:DNA-binding protein HU-beta